MFLGNYPGKLLLPEHAKRKRQASVRGRTKSARRRFQTQVVGYLECHLTTRPHETYSHHVPVWDVVFSLVKDGKEAGRMGGGTKTTRKEEEDKEKVDSGDRGRHWHAPRGCGGYLHVIL
jgi:hypothetical protein